MLTIGEFARLGQVSPRMLRHYDELGRLRPESVDPTTGYLSYSLRQLERVHRIVALRDIGERDRLRRVAAHLRALEWSDAMELPDVVVKQTQPILLAQATTGGLGRQRPRAGGPPAGGHCRELYEWHDDDPSRNVTELQQPIAR